MNEKRLPDGCPRCNGKMFTDKTTADRACFNCGHVSYAVPPVVIVPGEMVKRRRASHAGLLLDS